jgi:uncharacterized protein (DUF924 family)
MIDPDAVLAFWFPLGLDRDEDSHRRQFQWWFGGGADGEVAARFSAVLAAASTGALDSWMHDARSRLALILVLDQFPRSIHRGSAAAFAQDEKAAAIAVEGLEQGQYGQLPTVWEKTFFTMPLSHSEDVALHERNLRLAEALVGQAPPSLRRLYAFSASQARGHRDIVARFGRHPHRNGVLGRISTDAERDYIASGAFVHRRSFPG